MKIAKIHIDGYGAFDDCSIDGLHPCLSIIFGQNEAGKSTLLDFVRGVLFGFADGRSPRSQHRPLRGGRHGGRLGVTDDNGTAWMIERYEGKAPSITSSVGEQVAESFLRDLLGHTDKKIFESIFAFGLEELGQIALLHDDSVRDLIFSAGVLGAGRSASAAIKQLEDERSEITRNPRSEEQKSRLHRLAKRRDEIGSELRSAKQSAKTFERLTREIAREQRLAAAGLADLLRLQERKKELDDLEFASGLLENKAQLEERLERCPTVGQDQQTICDERRSVDELIVRFDGYRQDRENLKVKQVQADSRQEKIDLLLPDIGIDRATCTKANVSIATTSAVKDLVASYQQRQTEIGLLTDQLHENERDYAEAVRLLNDAANGRDPGDGERLRRQREDIRALRSMVSELRDLEHANELRSQTVVNIARSRRSPLPGVRLSFGGVALLGAVLIALFFMTSTHGRLAIATVIAGAAVLVVGIVGLFLYRDRQDDSSLDSEDGDPPPSELESRAMAVAELAATLQLPEHPAEGQIEAKDRSIGYELEEADRVRQLAREARERQATLQDTTERLERSNNEIDSLVEQSSTIGRELGLVQAMTPHALLATLEKINEVKRLLEADTRSIDPMTDDAGRIADYETSVASLLSRCGLAPAHPESIEHRLRALLQQCKEIEQVVTERDRLRNEIASEAARLAALLHRDGDRLSEELATSSPAEREGELTRIFVEEEAAKTAQLEHLQRAQELQRTMTELQGSTSIGDLELESESINAEIASILYHWSVLGLSSLLLKRTLQRYEAERQPAVIARAGELFAQVTEGRYVTLIAREDPQGHRNLEVLRPDGAAIEAQFLSKGTAEQLYLCVRLAYAENFAERSVALPLVLDDVLVNFDAGRTRQMAKAITTVSNRHQVLVFTCHPHTVDLFKSTTSDLRVIELDGC